MDGGEGRSRVERRRKETVLTEENDLNENSETTMEETDEKSGAKKSTTKKTVTTTVRVIKRSTSRKRIRNRYIVQYNTTCLEQPFC